MGAWVSNETLECQPDERGDTYWASFESEHFAHGVSRVAYKGTLTGDGPRQGEQCVVKAYKEKFCKKMAEWIPDLAASKKAKKFAKKFTEEIRKVGGQFGRLEVRFVIPLLARVDREAGFNIFFLDALKISSNTEFVRKGNVVALEEFLPGSYEKFNSNGGWENSEVGDLLKTFCHWTWEISGHNFMVCDLQGIKTPAGYLLTDPAVHSADQLYGPTDLGIVGMERVLGNHICNDFCHRLRLQNPLEGYEYSGSRSKTYLFTLTEEEMLRNRQQRSKFFKVHE